MNYSLNSHCLLYIVSLTHKKQNDFLKGYVILKSNSFLAEVETGSYTLMDITNDSTFFPHSSVSLRYLQVTSFSWRNNIFVSTNYTNLRLNYRSQGMVRRNVSLLPGLHIPGLAKTNLQAQPEFLLAVYRSMLYKSRRTSNCGLAPSDGEQLYLGQSLWLSVCCSWGFLKMTLKNAVGAKCNGQHFQGGKLLI